MHDEIALNVFREELWLDKLEVYVGYMLLYSNVCCNVDWPWWSLFIDYFAAEIKFKIVCDWNFK